jgi:hypothetical protein
MPCTGWDEDGIAWGHGALLAIDFHGSLAFEDEVEFFAELVVVAFGRLADGDGVEPVACALEAGWRPGPALRCSRPGAAWTTPPAARPRGG